MQYKHVTPRSIRRIMIGSVLLGILGLVPVETSAQNPIGAVSYPFGGEVLVAGDTCRIGWDSTGFQSALTILLWDGDASAWDTIVTNVSAADREYAWAVNTSASGERFRIRLTDGSRSVLNATYFTIEEPIELEKPHGAQLPLLDQSSPQLSVVVVPNPASLVAIVRANTQIVRVNLISIAGEVIHSSPGNGQTELQLPLAELNAGIYLVEATLANGQRAVTRLVVR